MIKIWIMGNSNNYNEVHFYKQKFFFTATQLLMMVKTAYFGAGCFWQSELIYSKIEGVLNTEVGFCEFKKKNNSKGRVEAVKVQFDSSIVGFTDLVEIFWSTHDASSKNNKSENYGEKSIIFGQDDDQLQIAQDGLNHKIKTSNGIAVYTEVKNFLSYKKAPDKDQQYYFKDR